MADLPKPNRLGHPYPPATPTPLGYQSPLHSLDTSAAPLLLNRDEVRIDGILSSDIDSTQNEFEMDACEYCLGSQSRAWLTIPKAKSVVMTNATQFYIFGEPSGQLVLHPTLERPLHVTIIGTDHGIGKPISARIVWITRISAAEAAFDVAHSSQAAEMPAAADPVSAPKPAPDIRLSHPVISANGRSFAVTVLTIRLSTVKVRVGLAYAEVGTTESLGAIASDYGALAAINGSFFDCYDSSTEKMPDMEVISNGEPVYKARIGTMIGFTPDGHCAMELGSVADTLHSLDPAYPDDWTNVPSADALLWQQVTEGLGAGPRLVRDGAVSLSPYSEGFNSAEVLYSVARRSAVGYTSDGGLLFVCVTASIPDLAHIMRELGCAQAMNLDGGASSGLWVHGKYVEQPGRLLSNALIVLPK
jgi:exopolysaccharide biosynthesis protein